MKSSKNTSLLRVVAPVAVAVLCLTAAGCPKPGDAPSGGGPAAASSGTLQMTLTVNPADAQNRRSASVKFEASAPMPDGQLAFELPSECRILAGAAVRTVKNLGSDKPVSQELAFECTAGATGALKVKFTGKDGKGQPLEKTAEGAL